MELKGWIHQMLANACKCLQMLANAWVINEVPILYMSIVEETLWVYDGGQVIPTGMQTS